MVRATDGKDLRDLFLVLLDERVRHAQQDVAVLSRHDAVPEQREHDLLGNVEPVGTDLPSLHVDQHFAAGAQQVRDGFLVLEPRLHQRVPLEVSESDVRAVGRVGRRRPQRAIQLFGAVRSRVRVLGARQPQGLVPRMHEKATPRLGEFTRVQPVEGVITAIRAGALPHGVLRRAWLRGRGCRGSKPALLLDACPHALHEDGKLLDVLGAIGEALPRAVAVRTLVAARERDERYAAHASGQQELEGVDRVAHDRLLVHAVAQAIERLADEARKRERRIERAAEVGALDTERGDLVRRAQHEIASLPHVRRGPAQRRQRTLQCRERPVLRQRRRRRDQPGGQVREDLAGPDAVRADLVGDDEPAGARAGRGAEHVHLRQARHRDDPVAPFGARERGVDEPAHVVETLIDRIVEHVAAMLHRHAHQFLDERARVDTACRVVRVVDDDGGHAAFREQAVELLRVGKKFRRRGRQLHDFLAGPLDEPVVFPARPRYDDPRAVCAKDLEHDGEAGARARSEQDLVRQEPDLGFRVVEQAVAVEELGDLAAHVHPADGGSVAVHRVAGDALRRANDLGMRREVRVLVVALREVQRALLLDAAGKKADEGLRRRKGAGGERRSHVFSAHTLLSSGDDRRGDYCPTSRLSARPEAVRRKKADRQVGATAEREVHERIPQRGRELEPMAR